jgi:hypothetical protein
VEALRTARADRDEGQVVRWSSDLVNGLARVKNSEESHAPLLANASAPRRGNSYGIAAGARSFAELRGRRCHQVSLRSNGCNGPLQPVVPADPVTEALDRACAAWISGRDGRRLCRDLIRDLEN